MTKTKSREVPFSKVAVLAICVLYMTVASARSDLRNEFPGPYCEQRNTCCLNRTDSCSLPIHGTLCYCDQFCNRHSGGDCCPDYESFCLGVPDPITTCLHKNRHYQQFETFTDNCNKCTCNMNGDVDCETDVCLVDRDLINNVNSIPNLGWSARNYTEFWGRKYKEGITFRLGTQDPSNIVKSMNRLTNPPENLPRSFNAKQQWPGYISEVQDQGWCGASWVISTTSVASDRFAIISKGLEKVNLSPQNILSCSRNHRGCQGGRLDAAWRYLHKVGVVNEECIPYEAARTTCRTKSRSKLSEVGCQPQTQLKQDKFYTMGPAYALNNESDIMSEIINSGPVQATIRVSRDFFSYSGGVYRHSAANRESQHGYHSVKLIGWGEEYTGNEITKYWIGANSWGDWWGEDGYFRILRGSNECRVEEFVLASWPHVHTPQVKSI